MNGFMLLIPFFIIRFGILSFLNKSALMRAAYFAPMKKNELIMYYIYQITNILIIGSLCFLTVKFELTGLFYVGLCCYLIGLILCMISIIDFSKPTKEGINTNGLYQFSRNPMYVAYFVYFLGCAFLCQSLILLIIVIIFQISSHWIILAEERWCIEKFGLVYKQYMKKVRRYF